MQRIQKLISASGYCSRRAAEQLIEQGRVKLNGKIAGLGDSADETDVIEIDNKPLAKSAERTYIILNKPRGYVTTMSDEHGRKAVTELVSDVGARVYPVGRLDMYSEGLLIFTDDGEFANRLAHPSHNITKTYQVRVRGDDIAKAVELLRTSLVIDGRPVSPAKVFLKSSDNDSSLIEITISEGRNRQVRKMCELSGLSVLRLKRVAEGSLKLGNLPEGKWRPLTQQEIENLQK